MRSFTLLLALTALALNPANSFVVNHFGADIPVIATAVASVDPPFSAPNDAAADPHVHLTDPDVFYPPWADPEFDESDGIHPHPHWPPRRRPHHPKYDFSNKTIYEILEGSKFFTKIVKAIKFDDKSLKLLNDSSASITFFAPPDRAIPSPPKRNHTFAPDDFASVFDSIPAEDDTPEDDEDDEKKKKFWKAIVHAILSYHTIPEALNSTEIGTNLTYPTLLNAHDGSYGGAARRVRISPPIFGHGGAANIIARFRFKPIVAKNGVLYVVSAPLLPPPSILEQVFWFPSVFSTYTSSIQKVNLTNEIQYLVLPEKFGIENVTTAPSVTAFVPTNEAFKRLPPFLKFYLFSPIGKRALKKLLQFHIVPNYIFHSDWSYNATSSVEETRHHEFADLNAEAQPWLEEELSESLEDGFICDDAAYRKSRDFNPKELFDEDEDYFAPIIHSQRKFELMKRCSMIWTFPAGFGIGHPPVPPPPPPPPMLRHFRGMLPKWMSRSEEVPEENIDYFDDSEIRFAAEGPSFPSPPKRPDLPNPPHRPDLPKPPHRTDLPEPPQRPNPPKWPKPPKLPEPPKLPPGTPPKLPSPPRHPRWPRWPRHRKHEVVLNETVTLPTLAFNHSIKARVLRFKTKFLPSSITTVIIAQGLPVALADGVARNGAVHFINRVLNPFWKPGAKPHRPPHRGSCEDVCPPAKGWDRHISLLTEAMGGGSDPFAEEDGRGCDESNLEEEYDASWENWEEWLPQWAAED